MEYYHGHMSPKMEYLTFFVLILIINAIQILGLNGAVEIEFLHTKECGNSFLVRNDGILPYNFSINPSKNHRILNEKSLRE